MPRLVRSSKILTDARDVMMLQRNAPWTRPTNRGTLRDNERFAS